MRILMLLIVAALVVMALRPLFMTGEDSAAAEPSEALVVTGSEPDPPQESGKIDSLSRPESSDRLARVLSGILADLVHGRLTAEDRIELENRIADALAVENLADSVTLASAARSTTERLLEEMRKARAQGGAALPESQTQPVTQAMAARLAGELKRALSMKGDGLPHDGNFLSVGFNFEAPPGFEKISWDLLGGFDYKMGMELPAEVKARHGKKVALAGYMMSVGEFEDIHRFALVESQWSCCFGMPPNVNQIVIVTIPDADDGIELVTEPILVYGLLDAQENVEDEWVIDVYRVKAAGVEIL